MRETKAGLRDTMTQRGRLPLVALLVVQILIGYEWFMSGLTKVIRGGFPVGLADELRDKSDGVVAWYKVFLGSVVIPNGRLFGYLIEFGELVVGVVMIAAAIAWLLRRRRVSAGLRTTLLLAGAAAALAGIFMNVNFHLANGSAHPWFIPKEGFDEGIDLDSLMPAIQAMLIMVSLGLLPAARRGPVTVDASRHDPVS